MKHGVVHGRMTHLELILECPGRQANHQSRGSQDSQELTLEDTYHDAQRLNLGNLPGKFVSDTQDTALGF